MRTPTLSMALTTIRPLHVFPILAMIALMPANSAGAQDAPARQAASDPQDGFGPPMDGGGPPDHDWTLSVGLAALYMPAYTGAEDYQAMIFPDIKVEYQDVFFASLFEGVGYNLINSDGWRAGPIVKYEFGRQEDDDNPFRVAGKKTKALRGMGNVDATPELGGFVEYNFDPFSTALELRQGVGGHKGLIGEISLNYTGMLDTFGPPVMYAIGPRLVFASAKYNQAFFGVNAKQSANSGLASYEAGSGILSYGLSAFAMTPVTDSLSVGLFAGYDRLGSEAADSPLIKERGTKNQLTTGLRLLYAFGF